MPSFDLSFQFSFFLSILPFIISPFHAFLSFPFILPSFCPGFTSSFLPFFLLSYFPSIHRSLPPSLPSSWTVILAPMKQWKTHHKTSYYQLKHVVFTKQSFLTHPTQSFSSSFFCSFMPLFISDSSHFWDLSPYVSMDLHMTWGHRSWGRSLCHFSLCFCKYESLLPLRRALYWRCFSAADNFISQKHKSLW